MLRASSVTVPRAGRNEADRLAEEDDLVSRRSRTAKQDLTDKHSQLGASNSNEDCRLTFDTVIPDLVRRHLDGSLRNRLRRETILAARPVFGGVVVQLVASGSRATCLSFRRHFRPHFDAAVC